MLISTAFLFPNELSFISYLDIANPKFTDNPASIALMSGININYDTKITLIFLFISAIIFFNSALMRTDTPHIKYSSGLYKYSLLE